MAQNEDIIRQLAIRAGIDADQLLAQVPQSGLSDALQAADEAKIGEMLEDAEAADLAAEQTVDTIEAQALRAKAQELRLVARLYLSRMAAAREGEEE
jgi:hypothetical protein